MLLSAFFALSGFTCKPDGDSIRKDKMYTSRYVLVVDGEAFCQDNDIEFLKSLAEKMSGIVQIYDRDHKSIYHSLTAKTKA